MQHFLPYPVDDCKCNVGSVLRRIDVDAERAFAEWSVNHRDDRIRHGACIRIRRNDGVDDVRGAPEGARPAPPVSETRFTEVVADGPARS